MARKVRIAYAGAVYHVINRGNYRAWLFETQGACRSFLECLDEACEALDWRLHVRAGLVEAEHLEAYLDSSFAHLWRPRKRKFVGTCLS